jgi:hypothetical protein
MFVSKKWNGADYAPLLHGGKAFFAAGYRKLQSHVFPCVFKQVR